MGQRVTVPAGMPLKVLNDGTERRSPLILILFFWPMRASYKAAVERTIRRLAEASGGVETVQDGVIPTVLICDPCPLPCSQGFHPFGIRLLYTSPSPRDRTRARMLSSA